jgi:hypothetical protein
MDDYTYLDIYRNVMQNKALYEEKCVKFFDQVVKKEWIENEKRKIGGINEFKSSLFLKGNKLDNKSFHWFLGTDIENCDKYIGRMNMNGWKERDFKLHEFDMRVGAEGEWGAISILDFAQYAVNPGTKSYGSSKIDRVGNTVVGLLKLSKISDIFADGYSRWVGKHKHKEHVIPRVITNKMQYILWKRAIGKEKMSKRHFENLTRSVLGKWSMEAYNELYKVDGLKEKRYFQDKIEKTWFRDVVNCNFELAKKKIELLAKYKFGKSNEWQERQVIEYVENVDLSTSDMSGAEFVSWVVNSGVLKRIRFKEKEKSYFKKELFVKHLESLYMHK